MNDYLKIAATLDNHLAQHVIRTLVQELEAAKADAARYRWLRHSPDCCVTLPIHGDWFEYSHDELDAAIDAAAGAAQKEQQT